MRRVESHGVKEKPFLSKEFFWGVSNLPATARSPLTVLPEYAKVATSVPLVLVYPHWIGSLAIVGSLVAVKGFALFP